MLDAVTGNINSLGDFIDSVTNTVPKVITGCAMLSAIVPKPIGDGALSIFYKIINILGFNFGEASNK